MDSIASYSVTGLAMKHISYWLTQFGFYTKQKHTLMPLDLWSDVSSSIIIRAALRLVTCHHLNIHCTHHATQLKEVSSSHIYLHQHQYTVL